MIRVLAAFLATFALSACEIGLYSAVDAAPFEARMAAAPFPDGIYCGLDDDTDGRILVLSDDRDGKDNCEFLRWNGAERVVTFPERTGERDIGVFGLAEAGDGLFLVQQHLGGDENSDRPYSFMLTAGAAHGDAVAFLPLVFNKDMIAMAAVYPGLTISSHTSSFMTPPLPLDAPADVAPPPPNADVYFVSDGSP